MPTSQPLFAAEPIWRTIFWASYCGWFFMEMWILSRDRRAAAGELKDRGSRLLIAIMLPVGLFTAFGAAYSHPETQIAGPPEILFWGAIALVWSGMALRLWAVQTLGRLFRTSVFMQDDHALVTRGPYRRLRNPSYTGSLITMAGIGLAMGNWLSLAAATGFFLVGFGWRIRVEERALRQHFGQAYTDYMRRSWALIPPIW